MPSKISKNPLFRFLQSRFGITCVVIIVFNILALSGIVLFFHASSLDAFVAKYPLLDPMRNFMDEQNIITTLQPIRIKFREIVDKNGPDTISLYFEYLNTGANISINPDLRILPASLIKVPLAMAVMKKVERGEWLLTNELVMMKDDRDTNWGDVHKRPVGSTITIQELIEEMLLNSDNTAYRILYRNMSFDDLQDVLINLGLEDLFNEEGKMSSKEYTRLIRALYAATYLDEEYSQLLLDTLSRTSYDAYLGQGIPDTVKFAHKIGENVDDKVISDSGVVYVENRPYMISVMINYEKMGHEKALQVLKQISEIGYSYISTAQHEKD